MDNYNKGYGTTDPVTGLNSQERFFADINHELKTPLNIIKGMNEMILRENISDTIKDYTESALSACNTLELQLNSLIMYSRMEANKIKPIIVPFSPDSFADEMVMSITTECRKKNIPFDFEISTSLPDSANSDPTMIKQVTHNLFLDLINCPSISDINLRISWQHERPSEGSLLVEIEANGASVYDEFYNANRSKIHFYRKTCRLLQGAANLVNNAGSIHARISIPISLTAAAANKDATDDVFFTAGDARILIVDDQLMNINVISMLLKDTLITIDGATSGLQALECMKEHEYDLIFIDYMMPSMDGAELMLKIKEIYPAIYKKTPIYVLSANINTESRELLTKCGFTGFIPKPVDPNLLNYIVRNNIDEKKISYTNRVNKKVFSKEELDKFRIILKKYSINLDNGLTYTSGDFEQYATIIAYTYKICDKNLELLQKHIRMDDITGIRIFSHTLKSTARQIGANNLSQISALIEENSAIENIEFINHTIPLYLYLIKELRLGTEEFLNEYNKTYPQSQPVFDDRLHSKDLYKKELFDYINNMEASRALSIIYSVISNRIDVPNNDTLSKIAEYIDELEYDDALNLLKEIM